MIILYVFLGLTLYVCGAIAAGTIYVIVGSGDEDARAACMLGWPLLLACAPGFLLILLLLWFFGDSVVKPLSAKMFDNRKENK